MQKIPEPAGGAELSARMPSSRLCPAIMVSAIAAIAQRGSQTSPASTTIEAPITQITCATKKSRLRLKLQPKRTSVNSITMSQKPRVSRKRLTSAVLRPRAP